MKIPVGMTYAAHAAIGALVLAACAMEVTRPGWTQSGEAQAWAMLLGCFVVIPAALVAAGSLLAAIVALIGRQRVPGDMFLLPAGFLVGIVGASMLSESQASPWVVASYVLGAGYAIMALTLAVRYRWGRRIRSD